MTAGPRVSRSWTWTYKRPPRLGWPNIDWADSWRPDRTLTINPTVIAVTVRADDGQPPVVRAIRVKGRWGQSSAERVRAGGVRRIDTGWIGLAPPGETLGTAHRIHAPAWVMDDIVADAVSRSAADMPAAEQPMISDPAEQLPRGGTRRVVSVSRPPAGLGPGGA